ncbi:MAG TPA: FlgD immunoglobulin-like domain containing protein, partial [bacterium]|nr:FlgD immunoglobulin-like domain containing protein [bacterium]
MRRNMAAWLCAAIVAISAAAGSGARAGDNVMLYIKGIPAKGVPGDTFTATIVVDGSGTLHGVDIGIAYNSAVLKVEDGDEELPGVNLEKKYECWEEWINEAVNEDVLDESIGYGLGQGQIKYNCVNVVPVAINGAIEIANIKFRVIGNGVSPINFRRSKQKYLNDYVYLEQGGVMRKVEPERRDLFFYSGNEDEPDEQSPQISVMSPEPGTINPVSADGSKREAKVKYSLSENARVTIKIEKENVGGGRQVVRTLITGLTVSDVAENPVKSIVWNGKSDTGAACGSGNYYVVVEAVDESGNMGRGEGEAPIRVERNAPEIMVSEETGRALSPNGDYVKDEYSAQIKMSKKGKLKAAIYDSLSGNKIKEADYGEVEAGEEKRFVWDGKNSAGEKATDGAYRMKITAEDAAGNVKETTIEQIVVDTVAPVIKPNSPTEWTLSMKPAIKATVEAGMESSAIDTGSARVRIDGGDSFQAGFSGNAITYLTQRNLGHGIHEVTASVSDMAGNYASAQWDFEVARNPEVEILGGYPDPFNPNKDTVRFSLKNKWNKTLDMGFAVYCGNTRVSQGAFYTINPGGATTIEWDGKWNAQGMDNKAHECAYKGRFWYRWAPALLSEERLFNADMTPPAISITDIEPAEEMAFIRPGAEEPTPSKASFNFSYDDNYSAFGDAVARARDAVSGEDVAKIFEETRMPRGEIRQIEWNGTLWGAAAPSGTYNIETEVTDEAGNVATRSVFVVVDATGPEIEMISPRSGEEAGTLAPVIMALLRDNPGGAGLDDSSIAVFLDGALLPAESMDWNAETGMLMFQAALTGNGHALQIEAKDLLGNETVLQRTINVDTQGIRSVAVIEPEEGKVLSGTKSVYVRIDSTAAAANIQLLLKGDEQSEWAVIGAAQNEWTHTFSWNTAQVDGQNERLYPDGTYEIKAKAWDMAGNSKESEVVSVTVDNTAPVLTAILRSGEGAMEGVLSNAPNAEVIEVRFTPEITEANGYEWTIECGRGSYGQESWVQAFSGTESVAKGAEPEGIVWDGKMADGTAVEDGEYVCFGRALDDAVNASNYLPTMATVETSAPALSVLSPEDGTAHAGQITMRVSASDVFPGVGKVECVLRRTGMDDEQIVEMTAGVEAGEYEYLWTTNEGDDGIWDVVFRASDLAGNAAESQPITITAANAPVAATNATATPSPFSPNGDGVKDSATINFKLTSA